MQVTLRRVALDRTTSPVTVTAVGLVGELEIEVKAARPDITNRRWLLEQIRDIAALADRAQDV